MKKLLFLFFLIFLAACSSATVDKGSSVSIQPSVQPGEIKTFIEKPDATVCTQDSKPIIRLFATSWCPHCQWIKNRFNLVVSEYVEQGKIVAHHWVVDKNDDDLTSIKESYVPADELAVFKAFNPRQSIPTFVFGCKYHRIGNGYESQDDLNAEETEFRTIIEKLIEEAGGA